MSGEIPVDLSVLSRRETLKVAATVSGASFIDPLSRALRRIFNPLEVETSEPLTRRKIEKEFFSVEIDAGSLIRNGEVNKNLLDRLKELGVGSVRYGALDWSKAQPTPKEQLAETDGESLYDEDYLDGISREIKLLTDAGLQVTVNIKGTPFFARREKLYTCSSIKREYFNTFAQFIDYFLNKNPEVKQIEIGNEPDVEPGKSEEEYYGCWGTSYDAGLYYGKMLKTVYPYLTNRHDVKIIAGALIIGGKSSPFLEGLLLSNEKNFDAISFHAYDYYPNKDALTLIQYAKLVKQILEKYEFQNVPIIHSEGAYLCSDYDTNCNNPNLENEEFELKKAAYAIIANVLAISSNLESYNWYSLRISWKQNWLMDNKGNPKPAFYTYKFLAHLLSPSLTYPDISAYYLGSEKKESLEVYRFIKGAYTIDIVWSNNGENIPYQVPNGAEVRDMYGQINKHNPNLPLYIGNQPVYIMNEIESINHRNLSTQSL